MQEKEFNLQEEPWIRVITAEGRVDELSLPDVLAHAHEYRRLAGELPTQDVAILRLLLAVLQTVVYRFDEDGNETLIEDRADAFNRWSAIWRQGRLPEKKIREYLNLWKERFWLFHPEYPFYQIPDAAVGTECKAAKLNGEISESNNKLRLFANRSGKSKECMSFSEAARWLLYVNGYDDTSAKPKQKGLPSAGAGWIGKLGLIFAEGENLFETIMLNLVLVHDRSECWHEPKPVWELDKPRSGERIEIAMPDNQAELLTLQSRRLLLKRNDEYVTGYTVLGGDFFQKTDAIAEQMTIWELKENKNQAPYLQPKRNAPEIQMWRGFANIVISPEKGRKPGVVEWAALLKQNGLLDKKRTIRFRTASVQYGDKDFFVADVLGDYIDFHIDILTEPGGLLTAMILSEIDKCEQAAKLVGRLASALNKAAGGSSENISKYGKEQYYHRIDSPFRKWLMNIDLEYDNDAEKREEIQKTWRRQAYEIAVTFGKEMVRQAGEAAFIGRMIIERNDKKYYYSSSKAFNDFRYGMGECFEIKAAKEEDHG